MTSPPRKIDAKHPTEKFLRKLQPSNDRTTASGSPPQSPLRNEPKDPILPPSSPLLTEMISRNPKASFISNDGSPPSLTEMVFHNPRVSDNSNFGSTVTVSPQRSSLVREAKDPSPPTSLPPLTEMIFPKPHASDYFKVGTKAKGPSQRSDNQALDDEATIGSPPPSFYDAEQSIPQPLADGAPQNSSSDAENLSLSSLQQSSPRDDGERSFSPSSSPPVADIGLSKPKSTKRNEEQLASPTLSPLRLIKGTTYLPPVPSLPRPPNNTPEKPGSPGMPVQVAAMAVASRLSREDLAVVAKVVGGGGAGVTGVVDGAGRRGGGWPGERGSASAPRGVEKWDVWVAALALRVGALVLSLIAFSVMAANKTQGWAGDTFDRYEEYRFVLSANVIVFVYSGFQVYATAKFHRMIAKSRILGLPIRHYFDLSMDQILSYLLMSASSAAASRNDIWVTRFNSDRFTHRIDVSVAMSFLAFFALASSSVISAYNLFKLSLDH